jgi:thioredoxin reductase (NADPH)
VAIIVPAILGGLAILVMVTVSVVASRKNRRKATAHAPAGAQPRILVHSINNDRCVGCDACVAVCPTNVLDLVENKSRVLRFEDCIQCEACMWACPTEALVMHMEGTEPPPLRVPNIDENFETPVKGQYLIGEVAGKPLVKNSANLGRMVVEHMLRNGLQKGAAGSPDPSIRAVDVAVVGSGPSGLSTALSCIYHGLSYVVLEKEQLVASTIARYPKGKLVMAEPYDVTNRSFLPVFDSSKEQIIPIWEDLLQQVGLQIQKGEAVEEVLPNQANGLFLVRTTVARYVAQRVVLATGTRGKPRTLGVPGENLPKIHSLLEDPDEHRGKSVLVVGGGDSALEAAIALADAGAQVSISYRSKGFNRAAPRNKATIESYMSQRRIDVYLQSQIDHFTEKTVTINLGDGSQKEIPNDEAFVLIGADPPTKFLEKVGVDLVERPHQFQLGKTDEKLLSYLGQSAPLCPENAAGAAALLRGETLSEAAPAQDSGGARKWLKSATQIFAQPRKTMAGVPLAEFANRRHTGDGRRDMLDPAERTRVLRMLRDVGGRMADEDDEYADGAGNSAPLKDDRLRRAGLRGVTYPVINIPKVPGLTQVLDAVDLESQFGIKPSATAEQRTVMGLPGVSSAPGQPPPAQPPGHGHGLQAASQLRQQARQQQSRPHVIQDAKTIVEMAMPHELLKHSVGARRRQAAAGGPMSDEHTVVADPRLFMQDEEKTQFAPPPGMGGPGGPDAARTLFDPGAQHDQAPAPDSRKTLFDPGAQHDRAPAPDTRKTLFDPGAQLDRAPAADSRKTLFDPKTQRGGAGAAQGKTLFSPGGAPANPASKSAPAAEKSSRRTLFGPGPQTAPPQTSPPAGGGQASGEVNAPRSVRSVNAQFSEEATTAADVSELVKKMAEERKRRGR